VTGPHPPTPLSINGEGETAHGKQRLPYSHARWRETGRITADLPLILLAVLFVLPVVWGLVASVKPADELQFKPWSLPSRIVWHNYVDAWHGRIGQYLLNSAVITLVSVVVIIALSAPAAYSFARLKFRGSAAMFLFLLGGLLIPVHAVLIPLYQVNEALWPRDWALREWLSIIGPYIAFGLPLTVLLLRAYFVSIPKELADAASIDGAGHLRTLWSVFLPVARPAVATVAIFQAAWIWNELPFAMVFIKTPALRTLPLGLLSFQGEHATEWQVVMAGVCTSIIPLLILYFVFQKHIIKGLTAGAVK